METKRLLIGLTLSAMLAGQVQATEKYPSVLIGADKISPKTHAVAFDNDDVLTENAKLNKVGLTVRYAPAILCAFAKNPRISYDLLKGACAEEWKETFRSLGSPNSYEQQFADFIQAWGQQKTLKPGMYETVQELHDAGYPISLYTNMGQADDSYFAQKFPDLYKLFTFRSCVSYKKGTPLIKKPSRESVERFVQLSKEHNTDGKTTIFVDDKLKNCVAGKQFGDLDYIHFKNPAQLRAVLTAKGAFDTTSDQ